MSDIVPQKLLKNNKSNIHPVMAGLAGAVAGAAGVTIIALTDKDIRKRVVKRTKDAKSSLEKWSADKLQEVQKGSVESALPDKEALKNQTEKIQEKISN
jgi:hypothetical protein